MAVLPVKESTAMPRPPLGIKPMNAKERRQKSDNDKKKLGEKRITTWITPEAAKALETLKKRGHGSDRDITSAAIIALAEQPKE